MHPDCECCGASFQDRTELEEHMQLMHGGDVPVFDGSLFECGDCQRSYPARDDLNRHVERRHTA